jgi:predicted ATPase
VCHAGYTPQFLSALIFPKNPRFSKREILCSPIFGAPESARLMLDSLEKRRDDKMTIERNNFFVIAGGPGSGKTTLIGALRARGQLCVDECIRKIIRQQTKIGGVGLHWKDRIIFRELILSHSMELFEDVSENVRPVFFDRGIPELLEYAVLSDGKAPDHVRRAAELFRYNRIVFIAPPWKEIYCTDEERIEDFDHAIEVHRETVDAYLECGYSLIELPCEPPEMRASFVLEHIQAIR